MKLFEHVSIYSIVSNFTTNYYFDFQTQQLYYTLHTQSVEHYNCFKSIVFIINQPPKHIEFFDINDKLIIDNWHRVESRNISETILVFTLHNNCRNLNQTFDS